MRVPTATELSAYVKQHLLARMPKLSLAIWIWIGAGVALALLLLWLILPRAREVEAAIIDRGVVRHEIVDEGRTRIHDVFVVAAPVGGELQRIELEPGDTVARGQVVATITPADPALLDARVAAEASAAVAAAQAALAAAQADAQLAQRDADRTTRLHADGFAAQAALDAARSNLRAARATVAARQADLQRARAAAGSPSARASAPTPVFSPTAGRVLRLLQQSEAITAAGAPLMEIGDPRQIEVVAEFLSQDAVLMHEGAQAYVEGWGGPNPIPARIFRIEPFARTKISALGVEEQRVNVIVHLEHAELAPPLGHGFRVDVRVVVFETDNAVRVPTDALVRNGAGWAAFRIERGRSRFTPVNIGDGSEDFHVVRSGLSPGQQVILFPRDTLRNGDLVRAANAHASLRQGAAPPS